jgi:hypothetical protein
MPIPIARTSPIAFGRPTDTIPTIAIPRRYLTSRGRFGDQGMPVGDGGRVLCHGCAVRAMGVFRSDHG